MLNSFNIIKITMKNFGQLYQSIGGFCLILSGFIAAVALSFHPSKFIPGSALADLWSPTHLALLIAFTLSVIGMTGVYSFLKDEVTLFNRIAYIFGMIGSIWSVTIVVIEVFVLPAIPADSTHLMPLMDMTLLGESLNKLKVFFFCAVSFWLLGWILTGIALVMSNKLPAYIGYFLIGACIGLGILTLFTNGEFEMLHIVFGLIFGTSWILLGNSIRKYDMPY
ncbi:MAG: hypothetical protein PSX81_06530 [bacterium]|nr:hypothetical protein [bacterium]